MNRKIFIKSSLLAATGAVMLGKETFAASPKSSDTKVSNRKSNKILNAYYLRAHTYTMVPQQVREDMKWMADAGTNIISVAILEQDLTAAVENHEIICNEAAKLGMDVWAVPSRWGGLLAGAPKVPSLFTIQNQETWMRKKDGAYFSSPVSGRISSIFHPATSQFMVETAIKMLKTWNMKGLLWDEPKSLEADYHELAIKQLGNNASLDAYIDANVSFYSNLNQQIKAACPNIKIGMFLYSHLQDMIVQKCATIENMDLFGCDGRPWGEKNGGKLESAGKILLDGVGQRFIDAAKANNKQSLWLIENHNLAEADIPLLKKGMPQVVATDVDHLIYYYYPRNLSHSDEIMKVMKDNIKNYDN